MITPEKENAKPILAIFDLDGTLTKKDTYLAYLISTALRNPIRIFRYFFLPVATVFYAVGIKNNTWLKTTYLSSVFGGYGRQKINQLNEQFIQRILRKGLTQKGKEQLAFHQQNKHRVILLSASLDFYVQPLGNALGIGEVIATQAQWKDDQLTGQLVGPNLKREAKVTAMAEYLKEDRLKYHIMAYGDHESDLPLLKWVDQGIWVKLNENLQQLAMQYKISLDNWH